jgi:hypothetical protein
MKAALPTIMICMSFVPRLLAGGNNEPAELRNLTSRYQQEIDEATNPIKARYIDDLKELLQSEMDAGNLKAAAAVNRALQEAEGGSAAVGKWVEDSDGKEIDLFSPNGKWSADWNGQHFIGAWKTVNIDEVVVTRFSDHATLNYFLNQDGFLIRQIGSLEYTRIDN